MNCKNCGSPIENTDISFCESCGSAVDKSAIKNSIDEDYTDNVSKFSFGKYNDDNDSIDFRYNDLLNNRATNNNVGTNNITNNNTNLDSSDFASKDLF